MEKYKQIYKSLSEKIEKGELPFGRKISKEIDLCAEYDASRITVRHALEMLEKKGYVSRKKKAGTVVIYKRENKRVAVVFSYFENCNERIENGLRDYLDKLSIEIVFFDSQNSTQAEREILTEIEKSDYYGVVLMPVERTANIDIVAKIMLKGIKLTFIDFALIGIEAPLVTADGFGGMETAVNRLIQQGHRKIAFYPFMEKSVIPTCEERFCGYCSALMKAEIGITGEYLLGGSVGTELRDYDEMSAKKAVEAWEKLSARPSAVVCANDVCAAAFIDALEAKGYHVPQDVSVCGFDNLSRSIKRRATTVWQDFGSMAREAVSIVLSSEPIRPSSVIKIKTALVERRTTATLE